MLPTLTKSLAGIHREVLTKHFIYCTPEDRLDTGTAEWQTIVDRQLICDGGQGPRDNLYKAVMRQLEISGAADAVIVMAQCDHVYGHGLRGLIEKQGDKYVVCSHGRIRDSAFPHVLDFVSKEGFTNSELAYKNYFEWQHPMVDYGLKYPVNYWRAKAMNRVIDVYFKEPAPVLFYPDPAILDVMREKEYIGHIKGSTWGTFETIDHDVVDFYYRCKKDKLYWCKNSDEFIWTEFTADDNYIPTVRQVEGVNACWIDSAVFFHDEPYRVNLPCLKPML